MRSEWHFNNLQWKELQGSRLSKHSCTLISAWAERVAVEVVVAEGGMVCGGNSDLGIEEVNCRHLEVRSYPMLKVQQPLLP